MHNTFLLFEKIITLVTVIENPNLTDIVYYYMRPQRNLSSVTDT